MTLVSRPAPKQLFIMKNHEDLLLNFQHFQRNLHGALCTLTINLFLVASSLNAQGNFTCPCIEGHGTIVVNVDATGGVEITNTVLATMAVNFTSPWGTTYSRVNGNCLAISGQLIIPSGYFSQLAFDNIFMQPGSEILVKSGAELFLSNLSFNGMVVQGCERMWRGVTVEDNATFTSFFTIIRDAQYAVTLGRSTITSQATIFDNNHVGIRTLNNGGVNIITTGFPFSGNQFTQTADALLPAFDAVPNFNIIEGYAGIELARTAWTSIGSMADGSNIFSDIRNGIIARENGVISMFNSRFNNLAGANINLPNTPPANGLRGIGIYADNNSLSTIQGCIFNTVSRGIAAINSNVFNVAENQFFNVRTAVIGSENNNRTFNVHDNDPVQFFNTGIGNFAIATGVTTINTNDLDYLDPGVALLVSSGIIVESLVPAPEQAPREINLNVLNLGANPDGIVVRNDHNYTMEYNDLYYSALWPSTEGITLDFSNNDFLHTNTIWGTDGGHGGSTLNGTAYSINTSQDNTYCCNYSQLTDSGWDFNGGCDNSFWRHTVIDQHNEGLTINAGSVIGQQVLMSNNWTGTYAGHSAANFHTSPTTSQFIVELPMTQPHWPVNPISNGQWFFPSLLNNNFPYCGIQGDTICPPPVQKPEGFHPNDEWYATTENSADALEDAMLWEGQYNLFKRLEEDPDLQTENTIYQDFYNDKATAPMGKLYEVESGLQDLIRLDGTVAADIQSLNAQLTTLAAQLIVADQALANATNQNDSLQAMTERLTIQFDMATIGNDIVQLYESLGGLDINALNSLRTTNASFTSTHPVEQKAQEINTVLFNFLEDKSALNNPVDSTILRTLAELCPFMYGHYVYTARAMMGYFDEEFAVETEDCSGGSFNQPFTKLLANQQQTSVVNIYPNPTSDKITIRILEAEASTNIIIKDLNGRKIWYGAVSNNTQIDVSELPLGIYFLTVTQEKGDTQTVKFIKH